MLDSNKYFARIFHSKTATSDGDPFEDIKKISPKKVVHTIIFLVLALLGRTFLFNLIYNWSIIQGNLILIFPILGGDIFHGSL